MGKSKPGNIPLTLVKGIVSLGTIYFVYTKIDLVEVTKLWQSLNVFYLLLAILGFIFSKIFSAYRLNYFFKVIGIPLSVRKNLILYLVGMFYNIFLPGGIGGDGYKIYLLQKHYDIHFKKVFLAVFSDRVAGLLVLVLIAAVLFLFFPQFSPYNYWGCIVVVIGFWGFLVFAKKYVIFFKKILPIVFLQSALVQLLQIVCIVFLLLALGQQTNFLDYMLVFLVSSVVVIIPITVGGLGLREATFLLGVEYVAIQKELAITLSFSFYLITIFVSLCGVFYLFKPLFSKDRNNT